MNPILQHIIYQMQETSLIEWTAFAFGVVQVVLALQNKSLNFYAGILSVLLYIYVFYSYGLYAESILNVYYFVVSIVGIFLWRKQHETVMPISTSTSKTSRVAFGIFASAWVLLYFILKRYTTSTVPSLDSFVSASAWAGTWLMIKRKLENWIVLNISNIVAIPLQFYKGLELTSLLTVIYFVIAILGYFEWKKKMMQDIILLEPHNMPT